ncbi:MAG: glycosyltransferase family 2 protein [Aerococcaceae bacterium]|nr:glycosyltransferase family 2 protein [Aerococcaceae bacterium]
MNQQPFFSVCVPVYNAESYLVQCLQSILAQSYTNFEVIVVNDGSTDQSQVLIEQFIQKDRRFKVYIQENRGLFATRASALEKAQGTYIVWLDADDYLENTALQTLEALIQQHLVDMVIYNHFELFTDGSRVEGKAIFENETVFSTDKTELFKEFMLTSNITSIWRKAIKRELFQLDAVKQFSKVTMGEDWIWSYYPMTTAEHIVYTSKPLINYRILPTSLTSQYDTKLYQTLGSIHQLNMEWLTHSSQSSLSREQIELKYLKDMAKTLAYIPGKVTNKSAYLQMLKDIRTNSSLKMLYERYRSQLSMLYRLPFYLLYRQHDGLLLQLKHLFAKLRKRK